MANIHTLKNQGVWAIPTNSKSYAPLTKNSEVGDAVIFTHKGDPVATGVLNSIPRDGIMGIWPDGETYQNTFSIKVNSFGRIKKVDRDSMGIKLLGGVVSYSNLKTYLKVRSELEPVNLSSLTEAAV